MPPKTIVSLETRTRVWLVLAPTIGRASLEDPRTGGGASTIPLFLSRFTGAQHTGGGGGEEGGFLWLRAFFYSPARRRRSPVCASAHARVSERSLTLPLSTYSTPSSAAARCCYYRCRCCYSYGLLSQWAGWPGCWGGAT